MACRQDHEQGIAAQLQGGLPPERWAPLRAHVAGCEDCRATYNRLAYAERLLEGGPAALSTPTAASLSRVERAVMAQVAPVATLGKRVSAAIDRFFEKPARWVPILAGASVAVMATVLLVPRWMGPSPAAPSAAPMLADGVDEDGFQPRGASSLGPARGQKRPMARARVAGVRVFCLEGAAVRALSAANDKTQTCPRGANLRFTANNSGAYRFLFLIGVDGQHAIKWYAPRPPGTQSELSPGVAAREEPVGRTLRLAVNHDAGPLRVYALFSDEPIQTREIEAAVGQLQAGAVPPASLPLPRGDVHQASVLVRITP